MQLSTKLLPLGFLATALTVTGPALLIPERGIAAPPHNFHVSLTLFFANGTFSTGKWFEDDSALPEKTPGSVLRACRQAGEFHLANQPEVVDYFCAMERSI